MPGQVVFHKRGAEIKDAALRRISEIQARLDRREAALRDFMTDPKLLRSYLVRSSKPTYGHGGPSLWSHRDISSERMEEVRQLCERIHDLESERQRLQLVVAHLSDDQVFEIGYDDLVGFGFEAA
jgi:hypothetical protein